eukprot:5269717-Pleurochrysis_carterae.AAC.1
MTRVGRHHAQHTRTYARSARFTYAPCCLLRGQRTNQCAAQFSCHLKKWRCPQRCSRILTLADFTTGASDADAF